MTSVAIYPTRINGQRINPTKPEIATNTGSVILHHHGTAKWVIPIKAIGTSLIARAPAEGFKLVYHDDHGLLERESSVYAAL